MKRLIKNIMLIGSFNIFCIPFVQASMVEPEALPELHDDFLLLLEGAATTVKLDEIDRSFNPGDSAAVPWSDSYWPIYKGLIATRYKMSTQPETNKWIDYYQHYLSNPAEGLIATGQIDKLSPAEKYDLLVGDRNWTLTQHMWGRGKSSYERQGLVATWTGICHGWSGAVQAGIPRPEKPITVTDVTGRYQIPFSTFDLMALTSYYWSRAPEKSFFVGSRCKNPTPPREDGHITDPKCFDNNPMTWHLGVTNRVGKIRKTIIMDTSSGTEVWNYVVDNYHYSYFNPQTLEFSPHLQDAIADRAEFRQDPFHAFRSERTKYLVGVIMDVFHPGAISPHAGVPTLQKLEWKRFIYDLELDDKMNVIGGEWHSKEHPDFLWGFPGDFNPFVNSPALPEPLPVVPEEISSMPVIDPALAQQAIESSHKGRVVSSIVYRLVGRSIGRSGQF